MMAPAAVGSIVLQALALGALLGALYDLLRVPRGRWFFDGVFVLAVFAVWIYLAFGICGGDIRIGFTLALAAGAIVWCSTLGKLFRPLFSLFWCAVFRPFEKLFAFSGKIYKLLLAIGKKWVTMVSKILHTGGVTHGQNDPVQAGIPPHKSRDQSRRHGRRRFVDRGSRGAV